MGEREFVRNHATMIRPALIEGMMQQMVLDAEVGAEGFAAVVMAATV